MRANLLDELRKPYVVTARAKGLPERRVILKYPVRAALNPFASTIGYLLPLPGLRQHHHLARARPADGRAAAAASLLAQDMFLAGTIMLLLGVLTVIGTLHLRSAADVDRSAHPARPDAMSDAVASPNRSSPRRKPASPSPPSGS